MCNQGIDPPDYNVLRSNYKSYIDSYNALYQLKTDKEEDLRSIYNMIKTELIDSKKQLPENVIQDILDLIPYNNRYSNSYLVLVKLISEDYQVTIDVNPIEDLTKCYLHEEDGKIILGAIVNSSKNQDIHSENTIYRAIMNDDKERFISFTESDSFDKNQKLKNNLYPYHSTSYSFLELCCYHGAVDCFKLSRSKFKSEITQQCLEFSFLGGNPDIMSECLKYQTPDEECMKYAIISHNIDFVTFLMNEYDIEIDLEYCGEYNNLEAFFIYFDQTNDVDKCFIYSPIFNIPSLFELFISLGADINAKDINGITALHQASISNNKKAVEFLLSHGANVNEKCYDFKTALHFATILNYIEIVELFLSHGANINEKDFDEKTPFAYAMLHNYKEIIKLFLLHGANPNEIINEECTALFYSLFNDDKEITELLLSHGANANERMNDENTALHFASIRGNKEIVEPFLLHGANINEKNCDELTALHLATNSKHKEIVELLLSHGASIDEKNITGQTPLFFAVHNKSIEIVELLLSHGANINEKDMFGKTPIFQAESFRELDLIEFLISHGANINETNNNGETLLDCAISINNAELIEFLHLHNSKS
ncbi:ankyrin repeat protein, putative [Trichomonas vaginalis G3]|uniref:Ankyrin repeat protein, putative n=1 Tax=Trichomonas vaginalis (strain ATCC PRA-98 / G3) TaxID=412133 RepID=A2DWR0_TRIV3|nr:ankyrin repeat and SOCS box-containing protein 4 family [Trichomonas vaginalis G3]EAY15092.1 ankyrin repeat protein, putative [Trichomonas vaginalis G3]KAI5499226.1 ankyrin repeat and SOCS box-containing protein 4 family [Trichomonas vaginalis G3]|eukprot:XP_001327315.1 ankyrin repeat protein [Trichomonas vaginalis G3]